MLFNQRSPRHPEVGVLRRRKQTAGHHDSMTDPAQRDESVIKSLIKTLWNKYYATLEQHLVYNGLCWLKCKPPCPLCHAKSYFAQPPFPPRHDKLLFGQWPLHPCAMQLFVKIPLQKIFCSSVGKQYLLATKAGRLSLTASWSPLRWVSRLEDLWGSAFYSSVEYHYSSVR